MAAGGVWNPSSTGSSRNSRPGGAGSEAARPIDLTLRPVESGGTVAAAGPGGHRLTTNPSDRSGIRPAAAAPPVTNPTDRPRSIGEEELQEGEGSTAVGTAQSALRAIGWIVVGTLVTVGLCLVATWLWVRERRRQGLASAAPAATPSAPVPPPPQFQSGLQDLVAQRLPLVEEPTLPEPGVRLYGPLVGHRRLYLDPPHASGTAPHFATTAAGVQPPSADRITKHLRAARRVRKKVGAAPTVAVAAAADVRTPPYDVVQPDSAFVPPSADAPTSRRGGASGESEDSLARALRSLREGLR